MCRCCCCLPICCCFSRKSRQSFPINEKKTAERSSNIFNDETNKVIVRPVQSIRLAKQTVKKTTITKKTLKENLPTKSTKKIEEKTLRSRKPLETLFQKVKPPPISSSPVPISIHSVIDDDKTLETDDIQTSAMSDWPSTTMSERSQQKNLPNVFSHVLGSHVKRENISKSKSQTARKSKLVLQNVRKMIDDQNSSAERTSESAQL